jgi:hypothetical protein
VYGSAFPLSRIILNMPADLGGGRENNKKTKKVGKKLKLIIS